MNVKEENVCRSCLNTIESEFVVIDDSIRQMFDVLLLTMNLNISKDPVICQVCVEIVKKSFYFKSACAGTELSYFGDNKRDVTFELNDIHEENNVTKDLSTCRFCMTHLERSHCVSINTLMNKAKFAKMFQTLWSEMNLLMTKNPVICASCTENLECYFKFVQNCLNVEEKINACCQVEGTNSLGQVNLSTVQRFLCKTNFEYSNPCTQINIIKQEYAEVHESLKTEETLDIKEAKLNKSSSQVAIDCNVPETDNKQILVDMFSSEKGAFKCAMCTYESRNKGHVKRHILIHKKAPKPLMHKCALCTYQARKKSNYTRHMLIHKDASEAVMHKCAVCPYETRLKGNIKRHMLCHKPASEVEMYKCAMCTFETKYKKCLEEHMIIHEDTSVVEMYKCVICTYETNENVNINSHVATHVNASDAGMYKSVMSTYEAKHYVIIHEASSGEQIYKCAVCTYESKHDRDIKFHILTHSDTSEVEMYNCIECTFKTKKRACMKRHLIIHKDVSQVEMYRCETCRYETKYKDTIKKHVLIHKDASEVKMYKCAKCCYETKRKSYIKLHMLIHKDASQMEMYKCVSCAYESKRSNFKRHILTHKVAQKKKHASII